jgi:hypothetical protein
MQELVAQPGYNGVAAGVNIAVQLPAGRLLHPQPPSVPAAEHVVGAGAAAAAAGRLQEEVAPDPYQA